MCRSVRPVLVTRVRLPMQAADLAYRRATLDVTVRAAREDLGGLWRSLLSDPVERAAAGLREAVPAVASAYGRAAGENAAIWYEDVRPASAPTFRPTPVVPASMADVAGLTTWAVTPLFSGDAAGAWSRLAGLVQKAVTDHDRETVVANAERDPATSKRAGRFWVRAASADACAFCAYMAVMTEGAVGWVESRKKFHPNCRCIPVPSFTSWHAEVPLDEKGRRVVRDEGTWWNRVMGYQPNAEAWTDVFKQAREELVRDQGLAYDRWYRATKGRARHSHFEKHHRHLMVNTENILARARRLSPDLFRDGVHTAA